MNMKKIILLFMLILCISLVSAAETRVTSGYSANVYLYSQLPNPVTPGNYVEVRIKIENNGVESLNDFEIEVLPEYPFSLDVTQKSVKEYGSIGSGNYNEKGIIADWRIRVNPQAVEGDNELRVRYKWGNNAWIYKDLNVRIKTQDSFLNIKDVKTIPENPNPGQKFELVIEIENIADTFINNLKFNLNSEDLISIESSDIKYLKFIDAGQTQNISFSLISKGNTEATILNVPIKIDFSDNEGTEHSKDTSFGIILLEEPQLIKNIEETEVVVSGDKGQISITISNIGVEEIKFMKATLEDNEDYRVVGNREIYLGNVDSDDFETANFDVYVKSKKDSVPLNLKLNYKDGLNNEYEENVELFLPLYSSGEARKLGLKPTGNFIGTYVSFVFLIFALIFWLYMLFDLIPKKMVRYQKLSWFAILILTTIFGAILYYFLIKRKSS